LEFLDQLSEHMGNAGCNDFEMENTPENVKLLKDIIKQGYERPKDVKEELEQLEEDLAENLETLMTADFMVFDYLRSKVEKLI